MVKKVLIQLVIFAIIFFGFSWYQESSMLSHGETVASTSIKKTDLLDQQIQLSPVSQASILYFFAPWCKICDLSISNLEEIKQQNPQLNVIAIALDYHTTEQIAQYAARHKLTMPVVLGDASTKKHFNISAYPSYYVIDENNQVVARSMGYSTKFGLYLRSLAL